jgi:hypothetical protein
VIAKLIDLDVDLLELDLVVPKSVSHGDWRAFLEIGHQYDWYDWNLVHGSRRARNTFLGV